MTHEVTPPPTLDDRLDLMAQGIRQLAARRATGALAEIRRLDVDCPIAPAFHELLAEAAPNADIRRFARVAQVMALKPDGLRRKPLGAVLRAIGFPETRLAMLLNARGPTLDDLVRRAARRIALSDEPMPYRDLGRLIVLRDPSDARDDLRIRIARDFQRAARKSDHADAATA